MGNSYVIRATCKIKIINNMFCPLISAYPHSQTADADADADVACSNKEDADADADVACITNADADADADIGKMRIIRGCGCGCEYPIHH